jgi:hypothetical protein
MNGQTNDTQAAKQADVPQATDLGNGREPQLVGSQKSQAILEKVKTFNWKLLGIITTLLGIAAGAISINQYLSEKPNLSINVEEMRFRPDNLSSMQKHEFILELERLEKKYEEHTGYTIISLIDDFSIFSQTSSGKSYNEQISELIARLDKAIDTIKRNDNNIPEVEKSELNKALTTMKEKIKPTEKENKDQNRVLIDLSVENRSRLPNVLYKTAVITFYKDNETTLPIELKIESSQDNENPKNEENSIDDNSFKQFTLKSSLIAGSLPEREKEFIISAFENEYDYILVIKDLNKKIWFSEGKALNFTLDRNTEELKRETLKIIEKKK